MSHPKFVSIVTSSLRELYKLPHFKQKKERKFVSSKESWHPCFEETKDSFEFLTGTVRISLFPSFIGVLYNKRYEIKAFTWMVVISGADDTHMKKEFMSCNDAFETYKALDELPLRRTLYYDWGFSYD